MSVRKAVLFNVGIGFLFTSCMASIASLPPDEPLLSTNTPISPLVTPSLTPTATEENPILVETPEPFEYPDTFAINTDNPFEKITVPALADRPYGGSGIVLGEVVKTEPGFLQYSMSYESDGLTITGLIDIPVGEESFPVVLVNHGYLRPIEYQPGFDSWSMADWLATHGYITIMSDYRNYAGSDTGPNPFRIGYAVDILNLIAQLDSLPQAIPEQVGIIGHSLGGEIALWPLVISDEVDAIVLYAPMSGDIARNWEHRWRYWPMQHSAMEATAIIYGYPADNPEGYEAISPENYFALARMPVHIHHGTHDEAVPYWWSEDMFNKMLVDGVDVTFFAYSGEQHSFTKRGFEVMMTRTLALFDEHVRNNTNSPDS